ncbi:BatA and WFA domain-containing protein [Candidatus Woesearchaeota archaeon]|nr:BatA and WFA domain-containing protein [Candidatus Woesearchaeota archaeon]
MYSIKKGGSDDKMVTLPFQRPFGLWALIAVAVFVFLYLRRPKPQEKIIPSLMFVLQDNKKSRQYSFFQKLMTNLLFLLQLLSILGLSLVAAAPFVKLKYDVTLENTVIILDVSASMQAKEKGVSRFDKALEQAKKALSGRNSIIMAENVPLIVLENENSKIALDVLSKIKPRATTTNLGDALLLAKDILGDKPGRIVVISDFIATEGPDIEVVRATLSSEDKIVDFVDASNKAKNTGITRLEVTKYNTKVYVKNFNSEAKQVTIKIVKDGKEITQTKVTIAANSIENFVFDTPAGISKVELEPKDDLEADDAAYIATPPKIKNSVLLITNEKSSNLELALGAAKDVELNVVNPPVLTINTKKEKIEPYKHDVVIVYKINNVNKRDGIVPGTFEDIEDYVEKGGNAIIAVQEDSKEINTRDLLAVELRTKINKPTKVCVETINQITKQFEKERCFTTTASYFGADAKKGAITFASANDKTPLIVYGEKKSGKIAYYGILDDTSDFNTLPSYPIFWNLLINFMIGTEDIKEFNHKTGRIATINEQKVKTPSSTLTTSKLLMDEVGIYEFDSKKFAVNLLDEKESDVNLPSKVENHEEREKLLERESKEHDFNLEFTILAFVFLFMLTEFFYIKRRGDL